MLFPSKLGGFVPSSDPESVRWNGSSGDVSDEVPLLSTVDKPEPFTMRLGVELPIFIAFTASTNFESYDFWSEGIFVAILGFKASPTTWGRDAYSVGKITSTAEDGCFVVSDTFSRLLALAVGCFAVEPAAAMLAKVGALFSFPPEATTCGYPA
jgi:hypothetical protein